MFLLNKGIVAVVIVDRGGLSMKVVIIGGDAAGMSAAMEIVRARKDAQVVVLEKGPIYSYGQCGLPYAIDGRVNALEDLIARSVEQFRSKYQIDARIYQEVTQVDTTNKVVKGVHSLTGKSFEENYDQLLIASGATPIIPNIQGHKLKGIHSVKTIPQMEILLQELPDVQHVTVIGGGYIGLEVTEALTLRGLKVTLVQRDNQLMSVLEKTFAQKLLEEAHKNGVDVRLQQTVEAFEGDDRVHTVITNEARVKTDLVIVATGISPNTQFAQHFQKLGNGALVVDRQQRTSIQDVYAAGDCASHFHRLKRADDYLALGTTANKQGRIAGRVIAGKEAAFNGIVGTSILQFFDLQIGLTGLTEREATEVGLTFNKYDWEANAVASYYKTPPKLQFQLLVESETERLLGLQMIGAMGVDKRIDVFATALYNEMTLAQLIDLDISYSPPFNGVWDPLLQVAKRYS